MTPDSIAPSPSPEKELAHILLVEDNVLERLAAADWLRLHGYIVLEAASADEASMLLASPVHVDVVITDVWMHGMMDGFDFARYIRRAFPHIHIVIVSGVYPPEKIAAENIPFFRKPYKIEEISTCIAKLLSDTDS